MLRDLLLENTQLSREGLNQSSDQLFKKWVSFILLQYKTSYREDTDFWKDHKNVKFDFFEKLYSELPNPQRSSWERTMYFNTLAGKDINWQIETKELPKKLITSDIKTIQHLELLEQMRNNKQLLNEQILFFW
jgi:hypothetical protein